LEEARAAALEVAQEEAQKEKGCSKKGQAVVYSYNLLGPCLQYHHALRRSHNELMAALSASRLMTVAFAC